MKVLLISITALLSVGLLASVVMAIQSQAVPETLGLQEGKLRPCPNSPNCVCSEQPQDQDHFIEPLEVKSWSHLSSEIQQLGGKVQTQSADYLHVTFSSTVFRYVDDVEFRLDARLGVVQMRSASRVGHSDFGVNRKRLEQIRQALASAR